MREEIRLHTSMGELQVEETGDPNYPGIWVSFRPSGYSMDQVIACIEQPNDTDNLGVYIYGDPEKEDWTHKNNILISDIKKSLDEYGEPCNNMSARTVLANWLLDSEAKIPKDALENIQLAFDIFRTENTANHI